MIQVRITAIVPCCKITLTLCLPSVRLSCHVLVFALGDSNSVRIEELYILLIFTCQWVHMLKVHVWRQIHKQMRTFPSKHSNSLSLGHQSHLVVFSDSVPKIPGTMKPCKVVITTSGANLQTLLYFYTYHNSETLGLKTFPSFPLVIMILWHRSCAFSS